MCSQKEIQELFQQIGCAVLSTKQTQQHSFDMAKFIVENNIAGDIVECGIAAGANLATMMLGALSVGGTRKFWGFDSFAGIQLAGKKDTIQAGLGAITHNVNVPEEQLLISSGISVCARQDVIKNFQQWKLWDSVEIELVEGWIQNTLAASASKIVAISILRLDMDIYSPTRHSLIHLFPLVSHGGCVIIDDWDLVGVRLACEEYFSEISLTQVLLDVENSNTKYFFKK